MDRFANSLSTTIQQLANTLHIPPQPSPSTLWGATLLHLAFCWRSVRLNQPQVDDSPWPKPYCFASPVLHRLLAPQVLPSVVKGGRCTWALAYPSRHSRRADRNPYWSALELFKNGGSWGSKKLERLDQLQWKPDSDGGGRTTEQGIAGCNFWIHRHEVYIPRRCIFYGRNSTWSQLTMMKVIAALISVVQINIESTLEGYRTFFLHYSTKGSEGNNQMVSNWSINNNCIIL